MGLISLLFVLLCTAPAQEEAVVATVGRFSITGRDLVDSYEFGPAFVKRYPNPLRKHLEYMIYERLLALEAERLGYDTSAFVRERVTALEEDLTVDELYKDEILAQVKLTDSEIEEAVQKERMNLRLRWLYSPDNEGARRLEEELKKGISFDSLYSRTGGSNADRSLETTLLRLERDTPELATSIAHLKVMQVSSPIEGPDGYYLVRIDRVWQNPVMSETDYSRLRDDAIRILRVSRADQLAADYVRARMEAANPVIKAEGFNIIRAYIADKGLSKDKRVQWDIPSTFMTEAGPLPIKASGEYLSRPLVVFGNSMLTVRDYTVWFDIRQFQLKTHSVEVFNSSIKRSIWKIVQDKLLSWEAYTKALNHQNEVKRETGKWYAKLFYLVGRSHVLRNIIISEDSLKQEYDRTKKHARDNSGKPLSFAQVRDQLWEARYYAEEHLILSQTLRRLKEAYPVRVDEAVVSRLAAGMRREQNPIDVIFYKPGGTFPRVAFPTIDESWQRFP